VTPDVIERTAPSRTVASSALALLTAAKTTAAEAAAEILFCQAITSPPYRLPRAPKARRALAGTLASAGRSLPRARLPV